MANIEIDNSIVNLLKPFKDNCIQLLTQTSNLTTYLTTIYENKPLMVTLIENEINLITLMHYLCLESKERNKRENGEEDIDKLSLNIETLSKYRAQLCSYGRYKHDSSIKSAEICKRIEDANDPMKHLEKQIIKTIKENNTMNKLGKGIFAINKGFTTIMTPVIAPVAKSYISIISDVTGIDVKSKYNEFSNEFSLFTKQIYEQFRNPIDKINPPFNLFSLSDSVMSVCNEQVRIYDQKLIESSTN